MLSLHSVLWGIGGGQQVGDSNNLRSGGSSHALPWSGTPESMIDLHPVGWPASFATGVAGGRQSGYVEFFDQFSRFRAVVWSGSRDSMVMLHGIDAEGNIIGYAVHLAAGRGHAVMWSPVPERGTVVGLGALLALLAARRRRRR